MIFQIFLIFGNLSLDDSSIDYFSLFVCLFVRYQFSPQPLNHLPSNLTQGFSVILERQLSILGPNG